jgi:hypothetical protein
MKKWLLAQPGQPATLAQLQALIDAFVAAYNQHRPAPLATAPGHTRDRLRRTAQGHHRPQPRPGHSRPGPHDKINKAGCVTLRVNGRLHHIGACRTLTGTAVLLLVQDLHIRVVHAATGELLRDLILDPRKDYQPTGRPPGPART